MKKLSLLMFAILTLGCGTEQPVVEEPVVEEPEPIIEEPPPVIEEPLPVVVEDDPNLPPEIAEGSVADGDLDVDPEPLNRTGIVFRFSERLRLYTADILFEGNSLGWFPRDVVDRPGKLVQIIPMVESPLLEYDTEYVIEIYVQDVGCQVFRFEIRFRTQPR